MASHAHGFHYDFPHLISRRKALGLVSGAMAVAPGIAAACVADASETAGPFPADGTRGRDGTNPNVLTESGVIREDLRGSFAGLSGTADGLQLDLSVSLVNVGASCAPLAGYAIYLWHCDAMGLYSLYDLEDQNFLRGVALTDASGSATATTIFPGCYPSRWPHIHFEIFESPDAMTTGRDSLLTGQLAFAETDCAAVYEAHAAYENGLSNLSRNTFSSDMVFRDDTAEQNAQRTMTVSQSSDGSLSASAVIGVAL